MNPQERHFSVNGLKLAALEWPGEGVPIIALHGWLDNAASFLPLSQYLGQHHLLALDLPGHGHSEHLPLSANYHLADGCRWVVALADAMDWERFVLLGHSMGAGTASITAAAVPRRVSGLVLIDGLGPLAFTPEQELRRLQQVFEMVESKPRSRAFPDLDSAVKVRRRLGRFPISEEAARLIAERGMAKVDGGYQWRHDERLVQPSTHYYSPEQAMSILRGIESPTLLITAEEGVFADWDDLAERRSALARVEHVSLPGRHHLHMEQPDVVAAAMAPFLNSLQGEGL